MISWAVWGAKGAQKQWKSPWKWRQHHATYIFKSGGARDKDSVSESRKEGLPAGASVTHSLSEPEVTWVQGYKDLTSPSSLLLISCWCLSLAEPNQKPENKGARVLESVPPMSEKGRGWTWRGKYRVISTDGQGGGHSDEVTFEQRAE